MALPVTGTLGMHFEVPFNSNAEVPEQRWLARLLRRPDTRAASAIVERTLARLAPKVPSASDVAGIYTYHRVSSARARKPSIGLWLRMLHSCLGDEVITDADVRYLNALRIALNLRERDVDSLWKDETSAVYRSALEEVLTDRGLTDDEWRQLGAIARGLRLSPAP